MPVESWESRRVAVYSQADEDSLHVRLADQAFCIGPAPSSGSYLNIPNIISTAVLAEVDAIHPGYGYLSEQAHFAEICHTHGIKFIGPSVEAIEKMGDKAAARRIMREAGLPVIPGSEPVQSEEEAWQPPKNRISGHVKGGVRRRRERHASGRGRPGAPARVFASAQAEAEASFR